MIRRCTKAAAWSALALATASTVITLTCRDAHPLSALICFGTPWLIRLILIVAAFAILRPKPTVLRLICAVVALHALVQGTQSFHWQGKNTIPSSSFKVTLWNAGRLLWKMDREWPRLAESDTKIIMLIEAGPFPADTWQRFTATHSEFTWRQLDGGIVLGIKGRWIETEALGNRPRFRCHRIKAEVDGQIYTLIGVDIPSQPWLPRKPMLDRILQSASAQNCLILGDFNTPPSAMGYDHWQSTLTLANRSTSHGFLETWCYGIPLLTLDQLWLSKDLCCTEVRQTPSLRSDHVRMSFRVQRPF